MKKSIAILLVLAIVLGLCACGGGGTDETGGSNLPEGLNVGFGRVNVTPSFSVGIGGYSDAETRRSNGFLDYIYTTCIAFTEGEETVLLFTLDNLSADTSIVNLIRSAVTAVLPEVSADHIFVSATHTHSAPSLTVGESDTDGTKYKELFYSACAEAAQKAMEDRAATTIYSASTQVEGMNFVRHYLLENGTYAGSNFGDIKSAAIKGHATETDEEMQLVKFDRADESKQDILLVNWQSHPDHATANGYTNISADFVGAARTKIEAETDLLCAYFTGAAGNQNPFSQITEEKHHLSMKEYGEALADAAIAALPSLAAVEGSGINTSTVQFEIEIDHSWDPMIEQANEVFDLWKSIDKASGDALGKTYGFSSVYQARTIKARFEMGSTATKELNVFKIGGIGFVNGSYEMFSDAGLYIKENSEYDTTIIVEGCSGYIPSAEAYDYRSYEADTSFYAKGSGEKIAEKFVQMLNSLN